MEASALDTLQFDESGLIPVIVQDADTAEVLMLGYANREALDMTLSGGKVTFFSRKRKCLWTKGETSGNTLTLTEMFIDCDADAVLVRARPQGPTCHTGERTCFYRRAATPKQPDPSFPGRLYAVLLSRKNAPPSESYTARLIASGLSRVAQKVGEEGVETALAVVQGDAERIVSESADLFYHTLVALIASGVPLTDVIRELEERHSASPKGQSTPRPASPEIASRSS